MIALPLNRRRSVVFLFTFIATTIMLTAVPVAAQQIVIINYPGATSTSPATINDVGQVVGSYTDDGGATHGFLLSGGVFTSIDPPGSTYTQATGINNNGQIVGDFVDANRLSHGFSLINGTFTTIDDPALPNGIFALFNADFGLIVGSGIDAKGFTHGFTLNNGVFTTIDFPGANLTEPLDVNYNGSEIVGFYTTPTSPANTSLGFTYINGTFASVSVPESVSTVINGVNNTGELVGTFFLSDSTNGNVFLLNGNTLTLQNVPGAVATYAADLNDQGEIIGAFTNDDNVTQAYLQTNGPFAYAPVRSANSVAVFDVTTQLPLTPIPVGTGPVGIGLSPAGGTAYVANYEGNSVSVIDTNTNTVTATVQVGTNPLGIAVTPGGGFAYVANNFSNSVSVISADTDTVVATIPVGKIASFVAITPNGNFAYVTNPGSGTLSVISTATNKVVATVNTGMNPEDLAITPNGEFVYVTIPGNNTVVAVNTATNAVVATIPVGAVPVRISITPDGSTAYVSNQNSDLVSVINLATNTVITDVTVGTTPYGSAFTPDGTFVWVVDLGSGQISIISTATNTVTTTLPLSGGSDIAIASAPPTSLQVTQPLSPTQPNVFNFGTNNFVVQYPAGSNFSGVNMTVDAVQITQGQFSQRVAGTQFANAACIVYSGAGGNCVDYEVTCSNASTGDPVTCPSEPTPTIAIQTSFATTQSIVNPGFLTTPIGQNNWTNIFTGFSDPTVRARTKGFSEFVAVDLGATNAQGPGSLTFEAPLRAADPRSFGSGVTIPVTFQLTSLTNPSVPVTDAVANLTLEMVSNASGQSQSTIVLALMNAFKYQSGTGYAYSLNTTGLAPGTYLLTVYGNAFAAQHVQFTINIRLTPTCVIRSSSPFFTKGVATHFTAIVQPPPHTTVVPTGTVTFFDSAYSRFSLGKVTLSGGDASIESTLKAPPDRQWIDFVYSGDNNFLPCTSQTIPEDYSTNGSGQK
jgi:YVTN family beta-propeller protein